jgi:integrase
VLLYCGLRRGEGLALRWRNIDFQRDVMHIDETAYKLNDGTFVIKEPKTAHSRRSVSIPLSLKLLLLEYKYDQESFKSKLGSTLLKEDFLFSKINGEPLNPQTVTHTFHEAISKAGLKLRLHDLRHTHATLMLKAGIHPKIVSERLGHANIAITLDTYSHVMPGLQEAAAKKFDTIIDESIANQNEEENVSKALAKSEKEGSEPSGTRTLDTLIKSQVLYQLS